MKIALIAHDKKKDDIIELAKNQDYDTFYSEEILTRKLLTFPPYCDICVVWAQSISREDAQNTINGIFSKIKEMLNDEYKDIKLIVLGPSPSAVAKVNNRYRYRMIIKCKNNKSFRNMLKKATDIRLVKIDEDSEDGLSSKDAEKLAKEIISKLNACDKSKLETDNSVVVFSLTSSKVISVSLLKIIRFILII